MTLTSEENHSSGTLIAGQYEVVVGPQEKSHLKGGMGLVYLCVDRVSQLPVALKTFQAKYLPNPTARDRFLKEGTLWVELGQHPFLVQALEVKRLGEGRELYFVLEYIAPGEGKVGASLREWLRTGQPMIALSQSLRWMWELAHGLSYATQQKPGFVHCDLKPENILIGRDGHARVTDLGLARCLTPENLSQEDLGQHADATDLMSFERQRTCLIRGVVGTPLYMAPEQWRGHSDLDARTDIYAWGCVLLELLTGRRPVSGKTKPEMEERHLTGQVRRAAHNIPSEVQELFVRCVAVDRLDRYATWAALIDELEKGYPVWTQTPLPASPKSQDATRVQRVAKGWSFNALGLGYLDIGKQKIALEYFQKARTFGEAEGDPVLQSAALGNLGIANLDIGDSENAIKYHKMDLSLSRKLSDQQGERAALNNLGLAHANRGDYKIAIEYYKQVLNLLSDGEDLRVQGSVLNNIGLAYINMDLAQSAMPYLFRAVEIQLSINNWMGEVEILINMGLAFRKLGDLESANSTHHRALTIATTYGASKEVGVALINLGDNHKLAKDFHQAITFYEKAEEIFQETTSYRYEGINCHNLSICHFNIGNLVKARNYMEKAEKLFGGIGALEFQEKARLVLTVIQKEEEDLRN